MKKEPTMIIQTNVLMTAWEAHCNGISTGGKWEKEKLENQINALELMAVRLAILTFTKTKRNNPIHLKIYSKTALFYL